MPSLTLQRDAGESGATGTGRSGGSGGPVAPDAAPDGPGPTSGLGDTYPEFSFDRGASEADEGEEAGDAGTRGGSDAGGDGAGRSGSGSGQGPGDGPAPDADAPDAGANQVSPGVEQLLSPDGPDLLAYDADVDRVVERLYRELERKMRIERERRGL